MHNHCVIPLIHGPDGAMPDIPDDAFGWGLLAEPDYPAPWGLYDCHRDPDLPIPASWRKIPESLEYALWSAYGYPPSLAIMRELVPQMLDRASLTVESFLAAVETLLRRVQSNHARDRFCFAEALADQIGYLTPGVFYWITGYYPDQDVVQWVSSDYFLYYDRRTAFRIDREVLAHLAPDPDKPWMIPAQRLPL